MREFHTPPRIDSSVMPRLTDDVIGLAARLPDRPTFWPTPDSAAPITPAAFLAEVRETAAGLLALGVQPGERIASWGRPSYQAMVVDYATWWVGAVSVPVFEFASSERVSWLLEQTQVRTMFVDSTERAELLAALSVAPTNVLTLAQGALEELRTSGRAVTRGELEARRVSADPTEPASIVYTAGTATRPRACTLSQQGLSLAAYLMAAELPELFDADDAGTVQVLPVAEVMSRVVQVAAVRRGIRLGFAHDRSRLSEELRSFKPTFMSAVPRLYEQQFNLSAQRAVAHGRGAMFDRATEVAIAWSRNQDANVGGRRRLQHTAVAAQRRALDPLVYRGLRDEWGGRCRHLLTAGAPLGDRLAHFYTGIGMTMLEAYSLAEAGGPVTLSTPSASRIGTVGRPLPGTTVRIGDDGEILVRSALQSGSSATSRPAHSSWLATGDLGEIDEEGFVRVTGRKHEIIVTAGGKQLSPTVLETALRSHPLIAQALVVGDGRPFVAALVTLDDSAGPHQTPAARPPRQEPVDPVLAEVERAVEQANSHVSRAEAIRRFHVVGRPWTEEAGLLTPSGRLRRHAIQRAFRGEIEALYASEPPGTPASRA